jgi:ubiquinone/menaquinone biosynthesis C-methylase UbiE
LEQVSFDKTRDAASYDAVAPVYDRYIERLAAPLARRAVALTDLKKGQRVLDVGTGSGIAARYAAAAVGMPGRVIGIDLSEGMVRSARQAAREKGLSNVEFCRMDAEALDLPSHSFDAVISLCAPAHFPNLQKALAEMTRVLTPGQHLTVAIGYGRPPLGYGLLRYGMRRAFMRLGELARPHMWAPHCLLDLIRERVPLASERPDSTWSERKAFSRLTRAVADAGIEEIGTYYEGQIVTFSSAEAFWDVQAAIVSPARKRLMTLASGQLQALRHEFLAAAQRTLDHGGRLCYPYGAFYVSGVARRRAV